MSRVALACTSHPPLMLIRPRAPAVEPQLLEHRERCRAMIERFDPEQIICFANNHFAGFHYSVMPTYCVGLAAEAVPDLGGFAGPLQVPADEATALLLALRDDGFDPAVSYRMRVDHAFSQPLQLLTGGITRYPVIPVFISVFTPPFVSFRRSRLLGEAVGRFAARSRRRTLMMGSGGLSHHPARYFPAIAEASPEVLGYQMDGDRGGTMDDAAWFSRFEDMHHEGAALASSGARTAAQMRLNAESDQRMLGWLQQGRTADFDELDANRLIETAGVGVLELHAWIAATAAYRAAEGGAELASTYSPVVEYATGFGMLYGA